MAAVQSWNKIRYQWSIAMKRETRERGINPKKQKWCPAQLLTTLWPVPSLSLMSSQQLLTNLPSLYADHEMLHGMEYPLGTFRFAALAMFPPSFLCTCSLPEHGKLKNPGFRVSTAQQQPKYQCVTNIIPTLNPKHSTVPAARKKSSCPIPTESRTLL